MATLVYHCFFFSKVGGCDLYMALTYDQKLTVLV